MDIDQAKNVPILFGKYSGKTIDQIATDDEGLRYLDWLRGDMMNKTLYGSRVAFYEALCVYLDDPTISRELDDALGRGD